jgi:hypothetical protein
MDELQKMLKDLGEAVIHNVKPIDPNAATPLFTVDDVVEKTRNMLSQLFRAIMLKEKVTVQEISHKQRITLSRLNVDPAKFPTAKTNLIAALARPAVSFNKFYEAIVNILGYKMDLTIHLEKDGVKRDYRYSELMAEMSILRNKLKAEQRQQP